MTLHVPDAWSRLDTVPPSALLDATLELHHAVQILAGVGQTFVAPRPDDSHRATTWDARLQGFLGAAFTDGYPFRLALRVADLTLHLVDRTHGTLGALPLGGTTLEEAYGWVRAGLSQYMGGTGPEIQHAGLDVPFHPVADGAPFAAHRVREREVLAALYGGAADVLDDVVAGREGASPVRCWPHRLDIGTLLTVRPETDGAPAHALGVGMAPMGGGYPHWYWYVRPWPYPDADRLPPLTAPARRHTGAWTGAVLGGEEVLAVPAERRRVLVSAFVDEALAGGQTK